MKPRYVTFEPKTYVGMQIELPHDVSVSTRSEAMGRLWPLFLSRASEIRGAIGETNFGLITPGEKCVEYSAASETERDAPVPIGFAKTETESGKFAVFTHRGSLETIQDTYDFIFSEWLPTSGHELRDESMLEIYDERFELESAASEIDIALPIE